MDKSRIPNTSCLGWKNRNLQLGFADCPKANERLEKSMTEKGHLERVEQVVMELASSSFGTYSKLINLLRDLFKTKTIYLEANRPSRGKRPWHEIQICPQWNLWAFYLLAFGKEVSEPTSWNLLKLFGEVLSLLIWLIKKKNWQSSIIQKLPTTSIATFFPPTYPRESRKEWMNSAKVLLSPIKRKFFVLDCGECPFLLVPQTEKPILHGRWILSRENQSNQSRSIVPESRYGIDGLKILNIDFKFGKS